MRHYFCIITILLAYWINPQTVCPQENLKYDPGNILEIFAMYPKFEDDGSLDKRFEKIPLFERHKTMFSIDYFYFPQYESLRDRYHVLYQESLKWIDNTPFSMKNKDQIRSIVRLYEKAILFGFDELYDLPIGIPLVGEGETIILHARSKESDSYAQTEWSSKFGRKVWMLEGEIAPGFVKIHGESVYIFDVEKRSKPSSDLSDEYLLIFRNLLLISEWFIDKNRCSDFQNRFENTVLSWSFRSLREYRKNVVYYTQKAMSEPSSSDDFFSKIEIPKLSPCQFEYEYIAGKTINFFMSQYSKFSLDEIFRYSYSLESNLAELQTGSLGVAVFLSFYRHHQLLSWDKPNRTKKMWDEIREIGVWEKIRRESTENLARE